MKTCSECRFLANDLDRNFCSRCGGCLIEVRDMVCIKCGKPNFMSPCYDCSYPKENKS